MGSDVAAMTLEREWFRQWARGDFAGARAVVSEHVDPTSHVRALQHALFGVGESARPAEALIGLLQLAAQGNTTASFIAGWALSGEGPDHSVRKALVAAGADMVVDAAVALDEQALRFLLDKGGDYGRLGRPATVRLAGRWLDATLREVDALGSVDADLAAMFACRFAAFLAYQDVCSEVPGPALRAYHFVLAHAARAGEVERAHAAVNSPSHFIVKFSAHLAQAAANIAELKLNAAGI